LLGDAGTTTINQITQDMLKNALIPLPPLPEQHRIVAKIEELLPLIDRYEQAWTKLEDFNRRFPVDMQKSLLQMAIQGKLVEQRPEEVTGTYLYRTILATKSTKKDKKLPPITEDEIPFEIPESWCWTRLGCVGYWGSGATPSRTKPEYYNGSIPWLKTGDLNDGYISETSETITDLALSQTSVRLNPVGSVLMAMYGATIGKLGIITVPMTTNQACCACAPYEGIYNRYLFFFLLARRQTFIKMGEGGAQPNISKEKIVNSLIPLPPFAEQKRIVAKLEELLPLCERLQ
jgi:type I restriction enzyme S subunit